MSQKHPPSPIKHREKNQNRNQTPIEQIPEEEFEVMIERTQPRKPCHHNPGSPERVAVLAKRYASGCELWHPDDKVDHNPPVRIIPSGPRLPVFEDDDDDYDDFD